MNELETVSIAEPLQNRQHARETPNAVNTRREREWEGELKASYGISGSILAWIKSFFIRANPVYKSWQFSVV